VREALHHVLRGRSAFEQLRTLRSAVISDKATVDEIRLAIHLLLIAEYHDAKQEAALA
jgi:hypothetical protein